MQCGHQGWAGIVSSPTGKGGKKVDLHSHEVLNSNGQLGMPKLEGRVLTTLAGGAQYKGIARAVGANELSGCGAHRK